jgi:hypothetical protein
MGTSRESPRWFRAVRPAVGVVIAAVVVGAVIRMAGVGYRGTTEYVVAGSAASEPTVLLQNTGSRRFVLGFFAVSSWGPPFTLQVLENDLPANVSQVVLRSLTITGPDGVAIETLQDVSIPLANGETIGAHGEKTPMRGFVYIDPKPLSPTADSLLVEGSLSLSGEGGGREVRFVRRFTRKQTKGLVVQS